MTARVLPLLAASAVFAAPVPRGPTDELVKEREKFIPYRGYQPLPGKVVGVLASDVAQVMGLEGRGGPPDSFGFGRDGLSYRWVYVPTTDPNPRISNLQLAVGEKGDTKAVYPALDMASQTTTKAAGITAAYTLVEVEVNEGKGAPADEAFVATKITPLDGTAGYPLKAADAVERARKLYAAWTADQKKDVDAAMAGAAKKALGGRAPTGPRQSTEVLHVSWLSDAKRLRVTFRTTVSDGAFQVGGGVPPPVGEDGQPLPRRGGARFGTRFGVEYGRAYELNATGEVVQTRTLAVEPFTQELPPPPMAQPVPLPLPPRP